MDADRWIFPHRRSQQARVRMFCLPFAGAGASTFQGWEEGLPPWVEVCPVQLPGRENRADEPPVSDLGLLAGTLARVVRPYLDLPLALFGHSMGALLAFELARALRKEHGVSPAHLFVSACPAPHLPRRGVPLHALPDAELVKRLRRLRGAPEAILRDPEWMEALLPVLRADLRMVETYRCPAEPPLDCPVTALGGWWDFRVRGRHLRAWGEQTSGRFALRRFPGGHFFLQKARSRLLAALSEGLARGTAPPASAPGRSAPAVPVATSKW